MANYLWNIKTIFLVLIISLPPQMIRAKPLPGRRSDLISGNEFLSLFLDQYDSKKDTNRSRDYYIENESSDLDEDLEIINKKIKDEEDLLITENTSNYGQRLQSNQSQKLNKKFSRGDKTSSSNITNKNEFESNDESTDDQESRQIVKFVTSGSKIVFLDDLPESEKDTSSDHRQFDQSKKSNSNENPGSVKQNNVKVISVSVSSTVARQKTTLKPASMDQQINEVTSFTSAAINDEFTESFYDDDEDQNNAKTVDSENKNDFINHARKSEFSIEETDPVTMAQNTDSMLIDSVNGESTNVHSILAPPHNIRRDSSSSSSSISTSIGINQSKRLSQNIPNASNLKTEEIINAPETIPFQTVIYHDNGYNKDGNAQPRSVSYSSIAQSIDQLNGWKESESLLEAKKNVSDSLKKPQSFPLPSQQEQGFSEPSKYYSEPSRMYGKPSKFYSEPSKVYSEPAKVYGQPERQYGEPSKIYSEPSKIYSEPSKVYSEPAKVYGVPSKVYWPRPTTPPTTTTTTTSTTTQFAIVGNRKNVPTVPTRHPSLNSRRVIFNLDKLPYDLLNAPEESNKSLLESGNGNVGIGQRLKPSSVVREQHSQTHHYRHRQYTHHNTGLSQSIDGSTKPMGSDLVTERPNYSSSPSLLMVTTESGIAGDNQYTPTPEQNYEIEESVSVMTNGRAHGIQTMQTTTPRPRPTSSPSAPVRTANNNNNNSNNNNNNNNKNNEDDSKVGYVVEGRNFRKYRVEEKTSDGFIVGEYGVVSHNDGGVRGVRYTADSNINPSLIHQALMKFLSL